MAGQRQPIELVLAKGSKHLTKKRSKRGKAQRSNRLPTIFLLLHISVPKNRKRNLIRSPISL